MAPLATVQRSRPWTAETTRPQDIRFPSDLPLLHALKLAAPQDMYTDQLAGRTASHLASWREITSNPWVLQAVSGYRLDFRAQPYQSYRPVTVEQDWQLTRILENGTIEEVGPRKDGFYSSLFLVPKKSGQMRPVINLRQVSEISALQDGGHPCSERPPPPGRLAYENRPQGCHPNVCPGQKVPEVLVAKASIPIHLPPFRPFVSTQNF